MVRCQGADVPFLAVSQPKKKEKSLPRFWSNIQLNWLTFWQSRFMILKPAELACLAVVYRSMYYPVTSLTFQTEGIFIHPWQFVSWSTKEPGGRCDISEPSPVLDGSTCLDRRIWDDLWPFTVFFPLPLCLTSPPTLSPWAIILNPRWWQLKHRFVRNSLTASEELLDLFIQQILFLC